MRGNSGSSIYSFDRFKIDLEKLMLYRDDAEITIQPKIVKTLAVLVENHGSILSKEELIEEVWADSVVEESNLSQNLYILRKILGNKPDGQPYIETLRRRGYRFTGDLKKVAPVKTSIAEVRSPVAMPALRREGNVVRVAEWTTPEPRRVEDAVEVEPTVETGSSRSRIFMGLTVVMVLMISAAVFLGWRNSASVPSANESNAEMSIIRLTNGIKPVDAAISPDGDYFVYHDQEGDTARMWLQQVGQPGRVEICSSSDTGYFAKTFSPDGRFIYFVGVTRPDRWMSLFRVATTPGPPAKLVDDVSGPVSFSADGREMVFLRLNAAARRSSLVVADIEGRNQRVILEGDSSRQIVSFPAWSPDGKMIAYAQSGIKESGEFDAPMIYGIDPSAGSIRTLSKEKWDTVYRIAWTNDGDGLVFVGTRENEAFSTGRDQIYFMSALDGESKRITFNGNRHQVASLGITKDGAILAVPANRSSQIWVMDSVDDAALAKQISTGLADGRAGLALLPDGRVGYIARNGEQSHVWIVNRDGSDAKQLVSDFAMTQELRADPNGRFFVFSAIKENRHHLYRIDTDGRNLKQLTFGPGDAVDSTISPDGNWIVYDSRVFDRSAPKPNLWRIPSEGGEPMAVSNEDCQTPTYSPDGKFLSCIRNETEILILSLADGSRIETHKLPGYSLTHFGVGWTPDGTGLIYIQSEGNFSNVWVQPRDGSKPRRLTNFTSGELVRYAYSPDGSRLTVARGYPVQDAILIRNFR